MGLILRWGLGLGLAIVLVDLLAVELIRPMADEDLVAGILLVDMVVSLVLYGWAGYQVGSRLKELRAGLEATVLAGVIAGLGATAYTLVRPFEELSLASAVALVAQNIVLAAGAGAFGAWLATGRRVPPPADR
jgi:hypothetical protein